MMKRKPPRDKKRAPRRTGETPAPQKRAGGKPAPQRPGRKPVLQRERGTPAPHKREQEDQWHTRPPRTSAPPLRRQAPKPRARARVFAKPSREREERAADLKEVWKPGTMLYPVPAALVTSLSRDGKPNVCTVAWTGTICSEPPMLSISLRPSRLSHENIMQTRQFVVNMPSEAMIRKTDYCGVVSGRDLDKFAQTGMTIAPASQVQAPIIIECPINIECQVRKTLELGTHTMFVAEIVAVQVNKDLITPSGRFAIEKAGLFAYVHGGYYPLGERLGKFGYSVKKKK